MCTGSAIEYCDPAVGVAVRGIDLLRGNIDGDVGRRAEAGSGIAVVTLALLADLQHEFALHREFEELPILFAVAGEPNKVGVVDENAVLALRPLESGARAAPVADQIAGLIEDQHRRCSDAALCLRRALLGGTLARSECARSVHDPNTIISIGSDAGDLS